MPSLSDKLRSLGVKTGAQDLKPPRPRNPYSIDQVIAGQALETPFGQTYLVEERYPVGYPHGKMALELNASLQKIAEWAGDRRIAGYPPQSFAFIDTETTGLQGGTGTYAFLVGVGKFEENEFHLAQFFMSDPVREPAQLAAFEQFIGPCQAIVTFNGKAFDVPLLTTRFISHGLRCPLGETAHVDLLHLARRLWRDRLPNRSLGSLEYEIIGTRRSEDDVPGWMIPSLYFEYLRTGDARRLKSVFYHNALDVVSMVTLFNHMARVLDDPLENAGEHAVDLIALAKLYEAMGDLDSAARLYLAGLDHDLPRPTLLEAIRRLALLYKRKGDHQSALTLWEQAAHHRQIEGFVELAKYYEHQARQPETALQWTQAAIDLVNSPGFPLLERREHLPELEHRRERLERKVNR